MSGRAPLGLFEGFGIELEYMIVDRATLAVAPLADALLREESGAVASELEVGELAWSNELALHLVELKTNGPVKTLHGVAPIFHDHVGRILKRLEPHGATLMPGMLTPEEMEHLAAAKGSAFDRLFLEGMIKHHGGALTMVKDLFATPGAGQEAEIFAFASDVDADQRMGIDRMGAMLNAIMKERK